MHPTRLFPLLRSTTATTFKSTFSRSFLACTDRLSPFLSQKRTHVCTPEEVRRIEEWLRLLDRNKDWTKEKKDREPAYFKKLAEGQSPPFLYVGCADSRLPLTTFTKSQPGDFFVHRNIANMVSVTDISFLSVLEYATKVLKVDHIVVAGHHGCGGVRAAVMGCDLQVIQNWVQPIRRIYLLNKDELDQLPEDDRCNKVAELNVIQQVQNLLTTNAIMEINAGKYPDLKPPTIHGVVIEIKSGLIKELTLPLDRWKAQNFIPQDYNNNGYIVKDFNLE